MQFSILFSLGSLLSLTLATTLSPTNTATATTGTTTDCPGEAVLQNCLAGTQAIAQNCATTDYDCLCGKWNDVLTCYNECPLDPAVSSINSTKITYCADAVEYVTSSFTVPIVSHSPTASTSAYSAPITTTQTSVRPESSMGTAATGESSVKGTATTGSASVSASSTAKSGALRRNPGFSGVMGMLVGFAGFTGLFL